MFFSNVLIEEFVLRSLEASPFTKPLFGSRYVTRCKECVLECHRLFEASPHIEN